MIQIGQVIGSKYRLVRLLGDGGMGSVYECVHERLGTKVAVKILHADIARRPGITDRFLQEARVAAQIKSEHIVSVSDVDVSPDGLAYMVMELLEGEPLSAVIDREKKLRVPVACAYAMQILQALEAAHAMNVVHRDLKPDNIFLTFVGQRPVLKLIDFGIAKVRRDDQQNLTMAGITMGTAEYMAPEQAYSADQADARADLYSVGVILYEMLSGTRPALGETARIVATKVERGEITPLVHAAPDVPQRLAGLVHRAMAPRPEMRFASATEMRLAIEAALNDAPAPAASPAKGGTLMTAPVQAVFAPEAPIGTTTQRAPPIVAQAPFPNAAATPVYAPPPVAYAPPAGAWSGSEEGRHPRRKRGSGLWIAVVVSLLLGAAAAVVFVVVNQNDDPGTTTGTPPTQTTTTTVKTGATSAPTAVDTLPTLKPGTTTAPFVPPPSTNKPVPATDAGAPVSRDASAPTPSTTGFPTIQIPPFAFPEGGLQLPSGFPPLFPPPPPPPP